MSRWEPATPEAVAAHVGETVPAEAPRKKRSEGPKGHRRKRVIHHLSVNDCDPRIVAAMPKHRPGEAWKAVSVTEIVTVYR